MKLSKKMLKVVTDLMNTVDHQSCILARRQADCQYLPDWFKDKDDAWYQGSIAANNAAIDTILMANRCYKGYCIKTVENDQFKVKYEINCYSLSGAR